MQQNFKQLKRSNSLHVHEGMKVRWPRLPHVGNLHVSKILWNVELERAYCIRGDVIGYTFDGELFVTPYAKEAISILEANGFEQTEFHVPFANGDLPQGAALDRWEKLLRDAHRSAQQDEVPQFKLATATA